MDRVITVTLKNLPTPRVVTRGKIQFHRFTEEDLTHTFLLKMVRRLVRETVEDILFLALAETRHPWTKNHDAYLAEFYAKDVNKHGTLSQDKSRSVPRHVIRSYIQDTSRGVAGTSEHATSSLSDLLRLMQRFDSGYIHGRASSIMRQYDPTTQQFLTNGLDVEDLKEETISFWLSAWLVIMSFAMIGAQWFGQEYWQYSWELSERFQRAIGLEEAELQP